MEILVEKVAVLVAGVCGCACMFRLQVVETSIQVRAVDEQFVPGSTFRRRHVELTVEGKGRREVGDFDPLLLFARGDG